MLTALMFALAISLAASVIFGLAPAWHVSRVDLADGLRQGGKGSSLGVRGGWARKAFVVTEIALAVALVMGAGLLGRSLIALAQVDMGFKSDRLVVLRTVVPVSGRDQFPRAIATYRSMLEELRAMPGVTAAGGVTSLPTAVRSNGGYWIQGGPGPEVLGMKSPQAVFNVVDAGLLPARCRCRSCAAATSTTAIASMRRSSRSSTSSWRRTRFPDVDPIGRTIRCGLDSLEPMTIVGIVKDVRTRGPIAAGAGGDLHAVRTAPGPGDLAQHRDAHRRGRSAGARRHRGAPDPQPQSRSAGARRDDGDDDGERDGDAAIPDGAAGGVCGGRAAARDRRCLRRDGVHREPARARDRTARGARRIAVGCDAAGAARRRVAGRDRAGRSAPRCRSPARDSSAGCCSACRREIRWCLRACRCSSRSRRWRPA